MNDVVVGATRGPSHRTQDAVPVEDAVSFKELKKQPLYASRIKIHPKDVQGTFRRIKWAVLVVLLGIYYLVPWIRWDRGPGAPDQAVLIDMPNRRAYFFWIEIWPQEIYYLTFLLILGAFGLFLATSLAGRVWCGFTCPQTVWTDLFMWVERKIEGDPALEEVFATPLVKARQIRGQKQRQRGWKLYSWHAREVECIGKGKAAKPYEFGVKVSIATTNRRCKGGQFVLHAKACPGNPYDGHTLGSVIEETQALTGREIERAYADKGYRGHDAPKPLRVFISGQKRGVHGQIKRELRRRSAIEAAIGHMKTDGHLGRNFLTGRLGDQANAVLTAVGYNLRLILNWLRALLRKIIDAILVALSQPPLANPAS